MGSRRLVWIVEKLELALVRGASIGLNAEGLYLFDIDLAIEANADPSSVPNVGRNEEPIGGMLDEPCLHTFGSCAPQVSEVMIMVAVGPEHDELLRREKGRCAMARAFGGLG